MNKKLIIIVVALAILVLSSSLTLVFVLINTKEDSTPEQVIAMEELPTPVPTHEPEPEPTTAPVEVEPVPTEIIKPDNLVTEVEKVTVKYKGAELIFDSGLDSNATPYIINYLIDKEHFEYNEDQTSLSVYDSTDKEDHYYIEVKDSEDTFCIPYPNETQLAESTELLAKVPVRPEGVIYDSTSDEEEELLLNLGYTETLPNTVIHVFNMIASDNLYKTAMLQGSSDDDKLHLYRFIFDDAYVYVITFDPEKNYAYAEEL